MKDAEPDPWAMQRRSIDKEREKQVDGVVAFAALDPVAAAERVESWGFSALEMCGGIHRWEAVKMGTLDRWAEIATPKEREAMIVNLVRSLSAERRADLAKWINKEKDE